jgi:hypothetical protein
VETVCRHYAARVPELATARPFTSKDIDFHGTADAARVLARRIGGQVKVPKFDDATPNSGVVTFKDSRGWERLVDFLKHVGGVSDDEKLFSAAVPVPVGDNVEVRLMNPIYCLESRAFNAAVSAYGHDLERMPSQGIRKVAVTSNFSASCYLSASCRGTPCSFV